MEASASQVKETPSTEIRRLFELQKANIYSAGKSSYSERKKKLKRLLKCILEHRQEIRDAIYADCRRHASEVDMTELYPVVSELRHTIRHLKSWMRDEPVGTPLTLFGSSSWIQYESKGSVLIISPWNFPVNLCFSPLVYAIAAGNVALLKPSEYTPNSTRLIKKIIESCFSENEVAVVEGGVETGKEVLSLPFNHIFFTGSPTVGKIVMKAAAESLASVTLELGGKSPTIVDSSADVKKAARRIAWGKFVNNGQICIAPDYVLVNKKYELELVKNIETYLKEFYPDVKTEASYSRIINNGHFERLARYIEDAKEKGAKVISISKMDASDRFIPPTIIQNASTEMTLLREEIFGPLLPIVSYDKIEEAIEFINKRERPLAMYIYSRNRKNIKSLLDNTRAGAVCLNNNALHFYNNNLPFGGVNNSGIGKTHGKFGFQAFSNAKAVYKQWMPNALELLVPPYNDFKQKLIDLTIRYF